MKKFSAATRLLLGAAFLLTSVLTLGAGARAQVDLSHAPPAYGVAQRLQAEAADARAHGDAETAHRRAYQAVQQLQVLAKSRSFGHTDWAREGLRQQAVLEEDYLQDKNAAVQSLQTLHNTFPDDKAVLPQIARVGNELDAWNQSFSATAPPLHNFGAVLYRTLDFLVKLTGSKSWSYWLAILMVSVIVKLALTPLSNKQYSSMKEMQKLQPQIQELQKKHKNDKELLGRKMMELYKTHSINPAGGCVPLLFQMPILYTLYYMIRLYQYQFSHGTFLWIGSGLSHLFPTYLATNLGQPDIPLLLLYAGSMYVTQRMTITPTMDPQQAETQKMMTIMTPFMTTYFFLQYHLPSAFVLYYLVFNVLSTAQQKYYMRKRAGELPFALAVPSGGDDAPDDIILAGGRPSGPNGGGRAPSRVGPIGKAESSAHANGAAPTARGVIAPAKVHPKKKRR